ncbi:MAG: 4-hydroxy-tetrahydrodipicolinate reductase [Deltaproteobacteria bacterium RBG_13_52_11]|nr:MAG: 4-hydroxy-tetrahydrodipicolinate reductase [Deltaproteobacteria bacterium RBG_13_52_11]
MINVIVVGTAGRMGRMVINAIQNSEGTQCTGAVEAPGHPAVGKDAGAVAGLGELGVRIEDSLQSVIKKGDVVIDFTLAESSLGNMEIAAQHHKAMVVGSTGFSSQQMERVKKLTMEFPCCLSPNMSVGVNLMFRIVEEMAQILGDDYDCEIIEAHHRMKKDTPSGTALRLGEVIAKSLGRKLAEVGVYGRKGLTGERSRAEIGMHAIRAGDIVGEHTVIFGGMGERIEVTHRAHTRDTFAQGAVRAARWVVNQKAGLYDMGDVLGLKG